MSFAINEPRYRESLDIMDLDAIPADAKPELTYRPNRATDLRFDLRSHLVLMIVVGIAGPVLFHVLKARPLLIEHHGVICFRLLFISPLLGIVIGHRDRIFHQYDANLAPGHLGKTLEFSWNSRAVVCLVAAIFLPAAIELIVNFLFPLYIRSIQSAWMTIAGVIVLAAVALCPFAKSNKLPVVEYLEHAWYAVCNFLAYDYPHKIPHGRIIEVEFGWLPRFALLLFALLVTSVSVPASGHYFHALLPGSSSHVVEATRAQLDARSLALSNAVNELDSEPETAESILRRESENEAFMLRFTGHSASLAATLYLYWSHPLSAFAITLASATLSLLFTLVAFLSCILIGMHASGFIDYVDKIDELKNIPADEKFKATCLAMVNSSCPYESQSLYLGTFELPFEQ